MSSFLSNQAPAGLTGHIDEMSQQPISADVLRLPAHLQPQPPLVFVCCMRCIRYWGALRKSEGGEWQDFTPADLLAGLHNVCFKEPLYGKCNRCSANGHECASVPPQFRRAANLLAYCVSDFGSDEDTLEFLEQELLAVCKYASKFGVAVAAYERQEAKEIREAGGRANWQHARNISRQENWQRHQDGLGGVGLLKPTNAVVDEDFEEETFERMDNASKRWYWFGSNVR